MGFKAIWKISLCLCFLAGCANHCCMPAKPSTTQPSPSVKLARQTGTVSPAFAQEMYERIRKSLVAVQYTFNSEMGRREIIGTGLVVGSDGLVMTSMELFPVQLPNEQMIDFKIIVPGDEGKELDAVFQGRDERSDVAFVKTVQKQNWPAISFIESPQEIGQPVLSVGLLPKQAGYHAYVSHATVAANLRGPVPQTLVSATGLTTLGAPVFDADGQAIGLVNDLADQPIVLNDPQTPMGSVNNPPRLYVPTRDFLQSLNDPPKTDKPLKLPWLGVAQLSGVDKEVSEFLHLNNQPAVQVGAVIPGFNAEKAGLKAGDIIIKCDGKALERGDEPEEAAMILLRKIRRMPVGQTVSLSVMKPDQADAPLRELSMTLGERPKQANEAKRFFASDLGFTIREMVFEDRYDRRLSADFKGVIIAMVKPGSSAQYAHLQLNDVVTQINRTPVTDIEQFKKLYQDFRKASPHEAVVLETLRGVNTEVIRIEPPQ